ncbi:MAG: hypothetical protein JXN61_02460 [Sedimentisphaerales bacterium]|nr:hypothetical protein [Sedimentisphaerales bacterium]
MDLNLTDSSLKKKYIYADRQILAQHDIDDDAQPDPLDFKYFYLHDRLGSVRLVINDSGSVVKHYTYEPFVELIDDDCTFDNAFRFTGQYFDFEIEEYYLRARQYNQQIARMSRNSHFFSENAISRAGVAREMSIFRPFTCARGRHQVAAAQKTRDSHLFSEN